MSDRGSSTGWALASFALGVIVGAAIGVLLAPASGEETRERLKETLDKAKEKGKELVDRAREKLFEQEGEEEEI
ncbi:MAG: YtxH domain-containing protein [candidate division WOR-3 bacterium]